jgi:hypothetical protein
LKKELKNNKMAQEKLNKKDADVLVEIIRDSYSPQSTLGKLFINGEYFCETLEDTVRAAGIKVKAHTALPSDIVAEIKIHRSNKFQRNVLLLTTNGGTEFKGKGISFGHCYLHGGNTHKNTEGCPLVAKQRVDADTIYKTMEAKLFAILAPHITEGKKVYFVAKNGKQAN